MKTTVFALKSNDPRYPKDFLDIQLVIGLLDNDPGLSAQNMEDLCAVYDGRKWFEMLYAFVRTTDSQSYLKYDWLEEIDDNSLALLGLQRTKTTC